MYLSKPHSAAIELLNGVETVLQTLEKSTHLKIFRVNWSANLILQAIGSFML